MRHADANTHRYRARAYCTNVENDSRHIIISFDDATSLRYISPIFLHDIYYLSPSSPPFTAKHFFDTDADAISHIAYGLPMSLTQTPSYFLASNDY